MNYMEQIKQPILEEFSTFEEVYRDAFATKNPLLEMVHNHILKNLGKRLRPILVLLSTKLFAPVNKSTYNIAISLEMLHTASLVHDDVLDETYERRGNPSVNACWDNKISILTGDYIISTAFQIALRSNNMKVLTQIALLGKELVDGELLQLSVAKNTQFSEENYLEIIKKKTANLFSVCTKLGAISANATDEQCQKMYEFGQFLGICFQIQDDIFDYSENVNIGKPVGNDIREGKVTIPLILALQNAPKDAADEIKEIINDKDFSNENIQKVLSFTRANHGIELAQEYMKKYIALGQQSLESFADCAEKQALLTLLEYTGKRNK